MSKPVFVYTTYIETTADKLWQALTDGDFTERYWFGHRVASDWQVGSSYRFAKEGQPSVEGKVLVSDPPRQLAYSWDSSCSDEAPRERTSRVTFDLVPHGKVIKLVVTHDELDEAGRTLRNVSAGWPMVLASLKSILETGHALDIEPAAAKELAHA
ncbi:SRPBCC family protein [Bradyrhizobium sp.]|uniref:SRPBCC family protein n=1 Tax=Bradyrhizobium sp. TaxID=376 RepID=UPI001ED7A055|nr:SRPBCC family protein [Bradyrhizobium sp.]MBV8918626.1 SRPBCC family protein [Bradyrhizobium sp.]MBV9981005.1 SRPBCC family protein [Bradyrhizobium sp.]